MKPFDLGSAFIKPDHPVEAGKWTTIRYTYRVGHPIDDTGYIKIAFRHVGDFGWPQFDDPQAPNYCTVSTTGDCRIEPRWDPKGHIRPWSRALFLKIVSGYLDSGEEIQVIFGETSQGNPGWQLSISNPAHPRHGNNPGQGCVQLIGSGARAVVRGRLRHHNLAPSGAP